MLKEKKKKKRRSRRDILVNYYIIRCGWLFNGQVAIRYLFARGLAEKWDRLLVLLKEWNQIWLYLNQNPDRLTQTPHVPTTGFCLSWAFYWGLYTYRAVVEWTIHP